MIPKCIYQTWKTKDLSPSMKKNVALLRQMNPEYDYQLFDDQDIVEFLQRYFPAEVLSAYLQILPGAFKADFWRYAVLYVFGGVYIDMDFVAQQPLSSFLNPSDTLVSVLDRHNTGVFQAFIACVPGHPVLKSSLDRCIANVQQRKVLNSDTLLDVTGPTLMARVVNQYLGRPERQYLSDTKDVIRLLIHATDKPVVTTETGIPVFLTKYEDYNKDQEASKNVDYRSNLRKWLKDEGSIPKRLHFIWYDQNDSNCQEVPAKYKPFLQTWQSLNPDFEITVWHNQALHQLFRKEDPEMANFFDRQQSVICKCDFARMMVIYLLGGVYSDLDFKCVQPIASLIAGRDILMFPELPELGGDQSITNGFFGAIRGHSFIRGWIETMQKGYREPKTPQDVMTFTGPRGLYEYVQKSPTKISFADPCLVMPFLPDGTTSQSCIGKEQNVYAFTKWKDGENWALNVGQKSKVPAVFVIAAFVFIVLVGCWIFKKLRFHQPLTTFEAQ